MKNSREKDSIGNKNLQAGSLNLSSFLPDLKHQKIKQTKKFSGKKIKKASSNNPRVKTGSSVSKVRRKGQKGDQTNVLTIEDKYPQKARFQPKKPSKEKSALKGRLIKRKQTASTALRDFEQAPSEQDEVEIKYWTGFRPFIQSYSPRAHISGNCQYGAYRAKIVSQFRRPPDPAQMSVEARSRLFNNFDTYLTTWSRAEVKDYG